MKNKAKKKKSLNNPTAKSETRQLITSETQGIPGGIRLS